ncbi:P-loop containing nucleoside triphosphate hydrolase protein [Cylindrobasidium torrendii FP15055 ss-10]|uniref:p-loop containing nucleoside triphosphate hydrolase protein n=1 Tax=Cylindrobasidium torrendii FP15055 ss-10 TaxID=1314674 RepID=A0A0D7AZ39_9AGAR|nr:P-loop containing nucleoside triphosphate hydrolase protein [Cylindrobasidium torrendii FP15055 ss-10]
MSSANGKRARTAQGEPPPKKRKTTSKNSTKALPEWPEYFNDALNTVLAFVTARRNLAVTFATIRNSVEKIIKRPLDLARVAELKALLSDMINFTYIPQHAHLVNDTRLAPDSEDEEHVLILDFRDDWTGESTSSNATSLHLAPVRSVASTKKLIDKRDKRFVDAVNNLLAACGENGTDAVAILQTAAHDHVPVNPTHTKVEQEPVRPVPEPEDRPAIEDVLNDLEKQTWYHNQISTERLFEAKEGTHDLVVDPPLPEAVNTAFKKARNIGSFYSHQVAAINALAQGKDVIVSTSTASGKSVIYQAPLLRFLHADPSATAIFVYPTKALAQDQRGAFQELIHACPGLGHVQVATYDGDTPMELRKGIRENASVILTNFDMIHMSMLPQEESWRQFLKRLKLFVVDELHYYTGLLGTHVAYILRRFRRICAAIGNKLPRFVSCSATISNPLQYMSMLFGLPTDGITAVTEDGAPRGERHFVVWQTSEDPDNPASHPDDKPLDQAALLMIHLMKNGVRTILFCKYRKVCELAMKRVRLRLADIGRLDILDRVKSYRGGYSAEDRRTIEQEAFSGKLLGIIATNALELGVDIGALDAVMMLGFPYSLASLRQQSGRAGRRARDSLAILMAESVPIDQHFVKNPDELWEKDPEDLVIDLESNITLEAHLQCAANEMPISVRDTIYFGSQLESVCKSRLTADADGWYHTNTKFLPHPARYVAIRGVQDEKYLVIDVTGGRYRILEEMEIARVLFDIYEGGVFLHQGQTYVVQTVLHAAKQAKLVKTDVNWITKPRDYTDINASQTHRIREIQGSRVLAYYGLVNVSVHVFGFFKIRDFKILDVVDMDNEPWQQETMGMWIDIPLDAIKLLRSKGIKPAAAIHGAQHAYLNRFALAPDIRTECKAEEKEVTKKNESTRKRPARLIFCDFASHGSGASAKAFDSVNDILHKAVAAVESCDCEYVEGCGRCIQSGLCKEKNKVLSRNGALVVLKFCLGLPVNPDDIPEEDGDLEGWDTIVNSTTVRAIGDVPVER